MGEVLAFSPRPPTTDWSANERGLLLLLTQQLTTSYGEVDGVFGQTDSGDPWYVVTDANQDVLVHIARIDGQFVVHDAAVDMFHQVGSLWGALRQVLAAGAPQEQTGVVVAFNPASREAQSFLSLVVAFGLYLEIRGVEFGGAGRIEFEGAPRASEPAMQALASKLISALNLDAAKTQSEAAAVAATIAAVARETGPQPVPKAAPAPDAELHTAENEAPTLWTFHLPNTLPAQAAVERPRVTQVAALAQPEETDRGAELTGNGFATSKAATRGTSSDDVLTGSHSSDAIYGGAGDDYIDGHGAGAGQVDRLDGGDGNDHIVMGARVVASGGAGADTFLLSAKSPTDQIAGLLGVVLDFSAARGDQLEVQGKGQMTVVSSTLVADVLAAHGQTLGEPGVAVAAEVTQPVAGARVGFDINGDGREDVFILLGGASATSFQVGMTVANDYAASPLEQVSLVGQPSPDVGLVGEPAPRG